MWLFLPFGFYSIVQHRLDSNVLLVRARARADLVALLEYVGLRAPIQRTPEADYPYRVSLPREELGQVLSDFAGYALDYENFKAEVARVQGTVRAHAYHRVWDALRVIEDSEARRPRPRQARARAGR
jgi:hypothetical protein